MELAKQTFSAFRDDPPAVGLLPIGSVEQHGPHAPLGTDLFIAAEVAHRGAEKMDHDVAVCPPIPIGVAAEHRDFPGSMWVTPGSFRAYVREAAASLASHGVPVIVLVNGHGGNVTALEEVATSLTRDEIARCATFTWFDTLADPPYPMGHGGPLETAAMLAIDDSMVRTDRIESAAEQASDRWGTWVGGVNLSTTVDEFTENGVVGDPRVATAELGETLLTESVENLGAVVNALRDQSSSSA